MPKFVTDNQAVIIKIFKPNLYRLLYLKQNVDPRRILYYTYLLPSSLAPPKLTVLVTCQSGMGKITVRDLGI
ncbi:hypothetical protein B0T18DRAFT_414350 [Schizothecium vesticola]|uniref:Uncharacterized protein n=1 Tax=Schizothecium vesticola TaxID=314040 RepID=A0AA40K242_9PEZI|nr:hypothetical protein B0T18DRAFT_414350 [Schizothecium vesticola]